EGERNFCRACAGRCEAKVGAALEVRAAGSLKSDRWISRTLVRQDQILGVVQMFADFSFSDSDVTVLERISDLFVCALDLSPEVPRIAPSQSEGLAQLPASPQPEVEPPATVASVLPQVGNCESCGFPVSLGRRFCVECEEMEADKVVQSVS